MSTVPEVVAARDEGVEVCVLSLVTNKVVIPERYRSIKEEVEAEVREHRFTYCAKISNGIPNIPTLSSLGVPWKFLLRLKFLIKRCSSWED